MEENVDEYKSLIGKCLKDLGYKIFYSKKDSMAPNECAIYYTDVDLELETTEDYIQWNTLVIQWEEKIDTNLRLQVRRMVENVEMTVKLSGVLHVSSFMFGKVKIIDLGTSYRSVMTVSFRELVSHG